MDLLLQVDDIRSIAVRLGTLRRSLDKMGNLEEFSDAATRLSQSAPAHPHPHCLNAVVHDSGICTLICMIFECMEKAEDICVRGSQPQHENAFMCFSEYLRIGAQTWIVLKSMSHKSVTRACNM